MPQKHFPWSLVFCTAGAIGLAAGQWFIFAYAPVEQTMGPIQKIFYIHLPLSWWALVSFFVVFICSAGYLAKRRESFDLAARAAAEIGVVFTSLCLITGIIWGRRSWGVWWTWDPRLSTALVMWFVYVAYLIMGSLPPPRRERLSCAPCSASWPSWTCRSSSSRPACGGPCIRPSSRAGRAGSSRK